MLTSWRFIILAVVLLAFVFFYTFNAKNSSEKPPSLEYSSRLMQERKGKDKYFKENENSPIENKTTFKALQYFVIDERYKIAANLERVESGAKIIMQTSDNKADTLAIFGYAKFDFGGKNHKLSLYKTENTRLLFLPFRDNTSGNETYGGGRFLDVSITDIVGNKVILDFNLAYHPYCAYNHTYICPIPPAENTLDMTVKAGEKLMK